MKLCFVIPLAIFGYFALTKGWIFLLFGLLFLKFAYGGCGSRCATNRNKKAYKKITAPTPLYDDKDIVPDGQSGFN